MPTTMKNHALFGRIRRDAAVKLMPYVQNAAKRRLKPPDKDGIHHSRGQAPVGYAARGTQPQTMAPDKGATIRPIRARQFAR